MPRSVRDALWPMRNPGFYQLTHYDANKIEVLPKNIQNHGKGIKHNNNTF